MKTISVIIPVYNQLEYFRQCIKSIQNQTYTNLEIICVDDGSTDGAGEYLDEIAKNDTRVIVFHQENKGESNARNVALEKAAGDYIAFADCDDWIEPNMYELLIEIAEKEDLDMIASSWYKEEKGQSYKIENELPAENGIIDRDKLLRYIYMRDSYRGFAYMWNKLYKRELLMDGNNIRLFDENLELGGDVLYLAQTAVNVKRAKYIDEAFYHYRIREQSGSHTSSCEKMKDWVKAYDMTINLLNENKVEQQTIGYAVRFKAYHAMQGAQIAIDSNDMESKVFFQKIMEQCADIYIRLNEPYPKRVEQYELLMRFM